MNTKENKISTCLWFDTQAEEAAKFYTSIFDNSKMGKSIATDKGARRYT
ncbi:MAG: VOC family protein [Pricia sp.]